MTIVRWDSIRDMAAREEQMNRMLTAGFYGRPQEDLTRGAWVPAVDIYSNGQHELVLKAELPDMTSECTSCRRCLYSSAMMMNRAPGLSTRSTSRTFAARSGQ